MALKLQYGRVTGSKESTIGSLKDSGERNGTQMQTKNKPMMHALSGQTTVSTIALTIVKICLAEGIS